MYFFVVVPCSTFSTLYFRVCWLIALVRPLDSLRCTLHETVALCLSFTVCSRKFNFILNCMQTYLSWNIRSPFSHGACRITYHNRCAFWLHRNLYIDTFIYPNAAKHLITRIVKIYRSRLHKFLHARLEV